MLKLVEDPHLKNGLSSHEVAAVVGIGADRDSITEPIAAWLGSADVVIGSPRQLDVVAALLGDDTIRLTLPKPLRPGLQDIVSEHTGKRIVVLASGDPMLHGIGSTMVDLFGVDRLRIVPGVSSVSLACARLGWAHSTVTTVSLVTQDAAAIRRHIRPGARLIVLSRNADTPLHIAAEICDMDYGQAELTVMSDLGSPHEHIVNGPAAEIDECGQWTRLNVVGVNCATFEPGPADSCAPGLPDDLYEHDGQLTKREVRAVTLAYLRPLPEHTLWDLGAGAGSIGIEWLRLAPQSTVLAVERNPERAARIRDNAIRLGVPELEVVESDSWRALPELPDPNVVFIGGGVTKPGLFDEVWRRLPLGGRLVMNAVALESVAAVTGWQRRFGGDLVEVNVSRSQRLGTMTGWQPSRPVVIWAVTKEENLNEELPRPTLVGPSVD